MRAVVIPAFGGPDVLAVADLPLPEPGPGQIRIRTAAAAVNPTDLLLRSGAVAAYVTHVPAPYVPGMDVAGTVDAVGTGTGFQPGQRVMAFVNPFTEGRGAQAEYVVAHAADAVAVPDTLDLHEAAAIPMNALTAHECLAGLPQGATVVVIGATGAVGSYAVQLARHRGLRVVTAAHDADRAEVERLGADVVVRRADGAAGYRAVLPDGADAVIDAAVTGADALSLVRDGGRLVIVRPYELTPERGITVHRASVLAYGPKKPMLEEIAALAGRGGLSPRIAARLAPEEASAAHEALDKGGLRGRQLIVF